MCFYNQILVQYTENIGIMQYLVCIHNKFYFLIIDKVVLEVFWVTNMSGLWKITKIDPKQHADAENENIIGHRLLRLAVKLHKHHHR